MGSDDAALAGGKKEKSCGLLVEDRMTQFPIVGQLDEV